nr:cellobiose phosphorylase [uncultured Butyrivibrio sp.]
MSGYKFIDSHGGFTMKNPQHTSGLYLPVAGNTGLRSAVTPDFGGDSKLDQNHFMIAPKSISNLHADRDTRNFFCVFEDGIWSATGASAQQEAARFTDEEDEVTLEAGRMWQSVTRKNKKRGISSEVTIFSLLDTSAEVMLVRITNESGNDISFYPVAAIPLYCRSADNIRDHRHVTSLLNRAYVDKYGVTVKPTLSFDERGHQINDTSYFCIGADEFGAPPIEFIADEDLFLGEGGTFLRPRSILGGSDKKQYWKAAPFEADGKETIGALKFEEVTLNAGQSVSFQIAIGTYTDNDTQEAAKSGNKDASFIRKLGESSALSVIMSEEIARNAFNDTKEYWDNLTNIHVNTPDDTFNNYMEWIAFQPQLRRIYGCSFLPHHDYGRGGRGWRDLWQDCLALLLTDPKGVREMILDNFKGVRMDGTNATIIGDKPGEFKADRNGIPRVWMDHGFWPFLTLKLYMDQTGDLDILGERVTYFKDSLVCRAKDRDTLYSEDQGVVQKTKENADYRGTVLEHILIQNLTAFYDVGENGEIRLRGADWNDALDMGTHKGESVAFTCGYAGNLKDIANYIRIYQEKTGISDTEILSEFKPVILADDSELFNSPQKKNELLNDYMSSVSHTISGIRNKISLDNLAAALEQKSQFMMDQIREKEWVQDNEGNGWFNGYYDDEGRVVEGVFDTEDGPNVRMMLTGQVFSIMSGTAKEKDVAQIVKSADKYLYKPEIGGYRLNTDFKQLRTDLGRMFGFSYGDKENGAVFSHMAVMFANALYKRNFAKEGYKALSTLYKASVNFDVSRIYPGVPEYFNAEGRGLYNYLTGAASWYLMTVVTECFGVKGSAGDLLIEPKLFDEQFDKEGKCSITLPFRGKTIKVVFNNPDRLSYGKYEISSAVIDGAETIEGMKDKVLIPAAAIDKLDDKEHLIEVFF